MGLLSRFFGPPDKDSFAKKLIEVIRRTGISEPIRYDAKEFKIVIGEHWKFFLSNIYAEYCGAKSGYRADILERFARATTPPDIPDDLEEALPNLVPRVRERFFYEATRLQWELRGEKALEFAHLPFADHFAVELGYDQPDSIALITTAHLEKWQVDLKDLIARSHRNLLAATAKRLKSIRPGLYVSDSKDNYDASRALLHDFIRSHKVSGEPVVAIPNRDTLILTGSEDEAGLKELVARARKALGGPRPMCGVPLVLSEGAYTPMSPEPGGPAYAELKMLCIGSIGSFYKEQRELLEALHEKKGEDIFVPPFSAFENKEKGTIRSMCSWTQGVLALLPETDLIGFVQENEHGEINKNAEVVLAEWARVQELVGSLITPIEAYPRRYRVESFPTSQQLKALSGG